VLVQIMGRDKLPLACRAAGAGCVYHFLAPRGALELTGGSSGGVQQQGIEEDQGQGKVVHHWQIGFCWGRLGLVVV
jgi:hypothetical protein